MTRGCKSKVVVSCERDVAGFRADRGTGRNVIASRDRNGARILC